MGVGMGGWSTAKVALQSMVVLSFILTVIDLVLAQHDGEIHLVHGTSSRNGRLEVYRSKEWVTIFDGGGFGLPEAVVACRQMGYRSGAVAVYHNGMFGRGTSDVRLHKIHCEGREMSLMECSYSVCSGLECNRDNDIGVSCGSSEDERYFRTTGFRRWSGFVVLLIAIPFCGHAYKRRSAYGQQSRSLIPIPRYHHGRVPLTSPLDDTAVTSSPGSPMQSFPNSPDGLPPEPVARVYPHGYVSYPHSTTTPPLRPMAAVLPTPALDTPNGLPRPSHFITSQPNITPEGMPRTNALPSPYSVPPPDYSELDGGMTSPTMLSDSVLILDPPPKYEDIVKS
ncbi:uncharacterized protein LOC100892077 [Strongylocentrotus purpuratus]|uniref:SRCR domain-containing protein n=1 Tax=Strongylocentrotus purpuratus TaxID=7668 RepID=A0A7M7STZ9_STRPU|nr:uncharacterized protein LOC100892077 [Strongylocentrotus purpuratus]